MLFWKGLFSNLAAHFLVYPGLLWTGYFQTCKYNYVVDITLIGYAEVNQSNENKHLFIMKPNSYFIDIILSTKVSKLLTYVILIELDFNLDPYTLKDVYVD